VFYGHSSRSPERLISAGVMLGAAFVASHFLAKAIVHITSRRARALNIAWGALCVGGLAFILVQRQAADQRGRIHEGNRELPNVVLVIVDALRQDVLGCYGNTLVKTPALDALAAQGVLFENAFVQVPFTWPSFGSLLTGKYPRRHGLIKMAPGERMEPNITLPYHLKTAARIDGTKLVDGDFVNATFHTGTLSESSGLLRGFDMRFEATAGHELVVLDDPWSLVRAHLLLSIFRQKIRQGFDSGIVATAARQWIGEQKDKRFFAMVHLYSTHTPYDPPREFKEMYVDPKYDGPLKVFYAQHREQIEDGSYTPTPSDVAQIRALYYAGVSQADRLVGEIVADLESAGIRDDTLVIITADHGESLGEQGLWEHNHMAQTNLRVPLLMSWPKGLPRGVRVAARVDQIDVLPTVCELMGLTLPSEPGERGRVDGVSLVPQVHGATTGVRPYSFAENGRFAAIQDDRYKLVVLRGMLKAKSLERAQQCWVDALAKPESTPRFFDLSVDPHEERNLVREPGRTAQAEALFGTLYEWSASMPIALEKNVQSERDRAAIELLQGLGYTGEGIGGDEDPACDEKPK
jgi:arylsulfatase A-like enzyme